MKNYPMRIWCLTFLSTLFKSYQGNEGVLTKGSVTHMVVLNVHTRLDCKI